jgi:uncharacterized protein (TIGR03067 family)
MRYPLLLALLAAALIAADDTKKDDKKTADPLKGTWKAVSTETNGNKRDNPNYELSFEGGKYKQKNMGVVDEEGEYKLGTDKKPATLDLKILTGMDEGKSQVGIYKIEGDTLTICFALAGDTTRPTDFTAKEDSNRFMVVLKRVKGD